jgi:hypothetical protein
MRLERLHREEDAFGMAPGKSHPGSDRSFDLATCPLTGGLRCLGSLSHRRKQ